MNPFRIVVDKTLAPDQWYVRQELPPQVRRRRIFEGEGAGQVEERGPNGKRVIDADPAAEPGRLRP